MRGSKAKMLRKLCATACDGKWDKVVYDVKNNPPRYVPNGELNPDGTAKLVVSRTYTTRLGNCERAMYQQFKRMGL